MNIFKRFGISLKKQPLPDTRPVGLSREIATMAMLEKLGEETDEILSKAQQERTILKLTAKDDEISQALETRKEAVIGTSWRLEPNEGPVYEFLMEYLEQKVEHILRGAFDAIPFGYSVMEMMWEEDGIGHIVPVDYLRKPFEWFKISTSGDLIWSNDGKDIDVFKKYPGKFILTRREPSYEHPAGKPLLSHLYWPWFFKSQGVELWATALERYGQPILIGSKGSTFKKNETLATFAEELRKTARGGVIAINDKDEVKAIGGANWKGPHDEFVKYADRQIQKQILGQNLTSEVAGGSYAAAQTHNLVRIDKRNADLRLVTQPVQEIIEIICHYNFPGQEVPRFVFDDGVGLQEERAERDKNLTESLEKSGLKLTEKYYREAYDLDEDHIEVKATNEQPPTDRQAMSLSMRNGILLSDSGQFPTGQQAIEKLVDNAVRSSPPPIPTELILAAVERSGNKQELERELSILLDDDANIEAFREHVAKSLFMADGWGYAASVEDKKS